MIFRMVDFPEPLAAKDDLRMALEQGEADIAEHDLLVEREPDVVEDDDRRPCLVEDLGERLWF